MEGGNEGGDFFSSFQRCSRDLHVASSLSVVGAAAAAAAAAARGATHDARIKRVVGPIRPRPATQGHCAALPQVCYGRVSPGKRTLRFI